MPRTYDCHSLWVQFLCLSSMEKILPEAAPGQTHIPLYINKCVSMYISAYMCVCIHIHIRMYFYLYNYIHFCMYICVCERFHVQYQEILLREIAFF